ncbi:MAG: zf-HC2 domain-containing protein, partial [Acidobacteriota bacterium]
MKCVKVRSLVHEYLDRELTGLGESDIEEHLDGCRSCNAFVDQLLFVQRAVSARVQLPSASQHLLWSRIQARRNRSLWSRLSSGIDSLFTYWRDLDRRILWSRLSAVPVSIGCFALLIVLMLPPSPQLQQFAAWMELQPRAPMITIIEAQQDPRRFKQIYDDLEQAIRESGADDEATLILDIGPGKQHVEVGDIRQYPNSQKLLEALVLSLRATRFEPAQKPRRILHIFNSIQVQDTAPQKG